MQFTPSNHPRAHSRLKHREIPVLRAAARKRRCGGIYDTYEMARTIDCERGGSGRLLKSELIAGLVNLFHLHPETARKRVADLTRDSRFTRSVHCGVIYLHGLAHVHQELGDPYLGRAIDVPIEKCHSAVARRAESYAGVIHLEERLAVNYTRSDREPVRQIRLGGDGKVHVIAKGSRTDPLPQSALKRITGHAPRTQKRYQQLLADDIDVYRNNKILFWEVEQEDGRFELEPFRDDPENERVHGIYHGDDGATRQPAARSYSVHGVARASRHATRRCNKVAQKTRPTAAVRWHLDAQHYARDKRESANKLLWWETSTTERADWVCVVDRLRR